MGFYLPFELFAWKLNVLERIGMWPSQLTNKTEDTGPGSVGHDHLDSNMEPISWTGTLSGFDHLLMSQVTPDS